MKRSWKPLFVITLVTTISILMVILLFKCGPGGDDLLLEPHKKMLERHKNDGD